MEKQFKCRVLDKEKKTGFFWDTYKITFRFVETGSVFTSEVSQQQYYDMPIGSEGFITLYKHSNNLWYKVPEM